jgi:hypothetical protein
MKQFFAVYVSAPARLRRDNEKTPDLIVYLIAPCLSVSHSILAQTYEGRILGTITDQSGAVIKDAKIKITNVDTGVARELTANEVGEYVAPAFRKR